MDFNALVCTYTGHSVAKKKICRSCKGQTNERCSRTAPFWSPYCWQHQKSLTGWFLACATVLVSFVGGLTQNVVTDYLKQNFLDQRPDISVSVNGAPLEKETVLFAGTQTNEHFQIALIIHNPGPLEAEDVAVAIQVPSLIPPLLQSGEWKCVQPDSDKSGTLSREIGTVHRKSNLFLPALSLRLTNLVNFAAAIQVRGKGLREPDRRVHIFFEAGVSNRARLDGHAATAFLSDFFRTNYTGADGSKIFASFRIP
jgi:hypothetical protein